jgi:hypothetical protein
VLIPKVVSLVKSKFCQFGFSVTLVCAGEKMGVKPNKAIIAKFLNLLNIILYGKFYFKKIKVKTAKNIAVCINNYLG